MVFLAYSFSYINSVYIGFTVGPIFSKGFPIFLFWAVNLNLNPIGPITALVKTDLLSLSLIVNIRLMRT